MLEKKFADIDKKFENVLNKNKRKLENAQIKPIHEKFLFAQNGITGLIAPPGSGKTFTYLKMAAQQQELDEKNPFYELVVICSTSGQFDQTVNSFKDIIKKSKLVCIKDTELLDWIKKYQRRVLKYNAINEYINSKFKDPNEEMQRILDKHHFRNKQKEIEYISKKLQSYDWKTYPHRCLLILDDFASHPLLKNREQDMCRILKKLRHFNISVVICVQTAKSLSKDVKRILTDIVLFPGLSEDDFMELLKESMAGKFDRHELWEKYKVIQDPHTSFRIHIYANKVQIVKSQA
ncbi:hypothetical protein TVAG_253510 [Trichomonas vaginalis G3]|uniref:Uncharacterized protein n=1 Tax=Trichomonas vaginalis (strain ATCC PRA-98 / G3) TaxID=412133 RepID=A2GIP6_TRIV3|nr:hypothetical protein TVAG_253510 [Trichomonas vaginalis G3]|eukprot:XP_001295901.1 hypothetical protein [Trichomonas vaginalis G3]